MLRRRRCSCVIMLRGIFQINFWPIGFKHESTTMVLRQTLPKLLPKALQNHFYHIHVFQKHCRIMFITSIGLRCPRMLTDCIDRAVMTVKPVCIVAKLVKSAHTSVQQSHAKSITKLDYRIFAASLVNVSCARETASSVDRQGCSVNPCRTLE